MDFAGEDGEGLLLSRAAESRRFDDPIFEAIEEGRAMLLDPGQDIAGEDAVVSACFDDLGRKSRSRIKIKIKRRRSKRRGGRVDT